MKEAVSSTAPNPVPKNCCGSGVVVPMDLIGLALWVIAKAEDSTLGFDMGNTLGICLKSWMDESQAWTLFAPALSPILDQYRLGP